MSPCVSTLYSIQLRRYKYLVEMNAYPGFGGADDPVRQMALKLRSILTVNSTNEILPVNSGSETDLEYPEVDCDEVVPQVYLGNA